MLREYRPYLPRIIVDELKADPTRWLLKARSPLVKWATYTNLLEWPGRHPEVRTSKALVHEDDDFKQITETQLENGSWPNIDRFPDIKHYGAYYTGTVWQLPLLADLRVKAGSHYADNAYETVSRSICRDGFFDLTGKGIPLIRANAVACGAFLDMGFSRTDIEGVLNWLSQQQRYDGGWSDFFELKTEDAPSSIKTTGSVLYALRSREIRDDRIVIRATKGAEYLLANLFGNYLERFPRSSKAWNKLSWPQYNFDILSIGRSLQMTGYGKKQLNDISKAIVNKQTHRGYWRQEVLIIAPTHITPVTTSRASRWLTFKAAEYFKDLHLPINRELAELYSN